MAFLHEFLQGLSRLVGSLTCRKPWQTVLWHVAGDSSVLRSIAIEQEACPDVVMLASNGVVALTRSLRAAATEPPTVYGDIEPTCPVTGSWPTSDERPVVSSRP
jgi:hypothetical protein